MNVKLEWQGPEDLETAFVRFHIVPRRNDVIQFRGEDWVVSQVTHVADESGGRKLPFPIPTVYIENPFNRDF